MTVRGKITTMQYAGDSQSLDHAYLVWKIGAELAFDFLFDFYLEQVTASLFK